MTATDRKLGYSTTAPFKLPCAVATTANISSMNGLLTIDGYTTVAGDRVLVKNQTDATQNGIYVADTGNWVRSVDFDGSTDAVQGTLVLVYGGAVGGNSVYQLTTAAPVPGTSTLNFSVTGAAALALASAWILANLLPASTQSAAQIALGLQTPMTTRGDIITGATAGAPQRLGLGAAGAALVSNGTDAVWSAPGAPVVRSNLVGLSGSTAGGSGTMTIASGISTDATSVSVMSLASAYTKTTSAWALGTGNGGLDTGAIANNTWYHWYLIQRTDTGVVDVIFSLSASAPAMPANYTLSRRLFAGLTDGSAHWVNFIQNGDNFRWVTPVQDYASSVPGATTRQSKALSVPSGIKVFPVFMFSVISGGGGGCTALCTSLDEADTAITSSAYDSSTGSPGSYGVPVRISDLHTDTSRQVGMKINTTDGGFNALTLGWVDRRGRDG